MKRFIIPLILFIFVVLEGVAIDLLPDVLIINHFLIVPHWVFIILVLVSVFYDTNDTFYAVIYGLIFGLLVDIVYTNLLGVYMFAYPLGIYIVHQLKRLFQANFMIVVCQTIISLFVVEIFIVFAYTITGSIHIVVESVILDRVIPSVLANVVFLCIMYPLLQNKLLQWKKEQLSQF